MNKQLKPNGGRPARPKGKQNLKGRGPKQAQVSGSSRAFIAQAKSAPTSQARISTTAKGSHVNHRELLGTVNGSVAFQAAKYVCNPGLAATFPWLSVQAQNWEQYRFNSLRFRYLTRTATTTVGSVIMAPDYDPTDSAPASEQAVSTYQDAVEDAVWVEQIVCTLNAAAMFSNGARKFVRSGPVGIEDLKLYDAANLFVCTLEEANTNAIGKLWVEYDVDFFSPQVAPTSLPAARHTSYYSSGVGAQNFVSTVPQVVQYDTAIVDPLGVGTPVLGVFTPPRGSYKLDAFCTFEDLFAESFNIELYVTKNGTYIAGTPYAEIRVLANATASAYQAALSAIVDCDGNDTFSIEAVLTGAAGLLQSVDATQGLLVSPA